MKNTVAIIQARMGSARLPGKVLRPIMNRPMLSYMLERLGFAKALDKIVVATSTEKEDDVIADFCAAYPVKVYRGSEDDVLDRYYQAAKEHDADPVVRLTADCPLIDPAVVDQVVGFYLNHSQEYDLVSGGETFADGLDTEIFSFQVLKEAWFNAKLKSEREHVDPYILEHFRRYSIACEQDLSSMRWTVDEEQDYQLVSKILEALYKENEVFHWQEIKSYLDKNPELLKLNADTMRNEGYQISLETDYELSDKYLEALQSRE